MTQHGQPGLRNAISRERKGKGAIYYLYGINGSPGSQLPEEQLTGRKIFYIASDHYFGAVFTTG